MHTYAYMFATCYHKSCENVEQMFCSSWDYHARVVFSWETDPQRAQQNVPHGYSNGATGKEYLYMGLTQFY